MTSLRFKVSPIEKLHEYGSRPPVERYPMRISARDGEPIEIVMDPPDKATIEELLKMRHTGTPIMLPNGSQSIYRSDPAVAILERLLDWESDGGHVGPLGDELQSIIWDARKLLGRGPYQA